MNFNIVELSTELDSHTDTCVVGKNCLIVQEFDRCVSVTGYAPALGSQNERQIVTAALAYDCPDNGETVILVIHQAILIETMENNLLCPMQLRMAGIRVNDKPKFLTHKPTEDDHCICIPDKDEVIRIPLELKGVTSYFNARKPSLAEYDDDNIRKLELTIEDPEWDPHSPDFAQLEQRYFDGLGRFKEVGDEEKRRIYSLSRNSLTFEAESYVNQTCRSVAALAEISPTLIEGDFAKSLKDNVNVFDVMSKGDRQSSAVTGKKIYSVTPEDLVKRWRCGIDTARQTIKVTTQRGIRTVANPSISRRFRTNDRQLRYNRLRADVFTDTLKAKTKSYRGNHYAQAYGTSFKWARCHAMQTRSQAHHTISTLFTRDGVPNNMFCDNAMEQIGGEFRRKVQEAGCYMKSTEPHTPWTNYAESTIREVKKSSSRKMQSTGCPKRFWDDCIEMEAMIMSHTAHPLWELKGEVPETVMTGNTADISQFADLAWYDWVFFRDTTIAFPDDKEVLGKYLGPSFDIGPAMCAKFLKENGEVVHRSTYRPLTKDELESPKIKDDMTRFNQAINDRHGEGITYEDTKDPILKDYMTPHLSRYEDDHGGGLEHAPDEEEIDASTYDQYVNAEVLLPHGGKMATGKVVGRKRDHEGNLIGKHNPYPILDTRVYEVEFPDGSEASYAANVIAENMYAMCDTNGNQHLLMDEIVDHKTDGHAVNVADQYITVKGRKSKRKTTKGWSLCVKWKDGTTSWERLADVKESNPVEVAEYAVASSIAHEPAFDWWVPYTLRKRNRMIAVVNQRYAKRNYKFGFEIPKSVEDAIRIDKENGNTLWMDALRKEMKAIRVAFKFLDDKDAKLPPGHQLIRGHVIWDVKMEDLRRKARYVAQGNMTEPPKTLTYASVVSRESVRIAMTLAALNDLEMKSADIQNAYLTAPCQEKICIRVGSEFGEDSGKLAIIVRALYGLVSSGAAFRNHLADCMSHLGYESCLADRDVWYKAMTRPDDGFKYYSYILLYVDDVLCVHHNAGEALQKIDYYFTMKKESIGDPSMYLGAKVCKVTLNNGVECWGLSPSKYVQEAVKTVEKHLNDKYNTGLPKKVRTPYPKDYRPELDLSPELGPSEASYYHSCIGVLRWIVELGRVDIITEVSLLASHLALPRKGHLDTVIRIFAYLKNKHNSLMVFDPTYPEIDERDFLECDWKDFYGDAKEPIPPNAPDPRGKEVDLRLFVDSDHAGDKTNRRSRTGFFIYMNMAPIAWNSKKQSTVESSVFGAEFCAMKIGIETCRGLRYKLRMMGVPISGPTYVYGNNRSVIHNTQRPESTLKKKSNSIAYHACRESVAMGESKTGHVSSVNNPADLCTKVLPGGEKRNRAIDMVLHFVEEPDAV